VVFFQDIECYLIFSSDGNVRYYEVESDTMYPLSEHKSSDPQRGMCFLPRRALDVSECEIARAYKVAANTIEPIAFIVPRKVCASFLLKAIVRCA
jgi:coronin-1B/1C/6